MLVRSALTARPVLGGTVAGVTATVSLTLLPGSVKDGDAGPSPEGFVGSPPHEWVGEAVFRGIGAMVMKS